MNFPCSFFFIAGQVAVLQRALVVVSATRLTLNRVLQLSLWGSQDSCANTTNLAAVSNYHNNAAQVKAKTIEEESEDRIPV